MTTLWAKLDLSSRVSPVLCLLKIFQSGNSHCLVRARLLIARRIRRILSHRRSSKRLKETIVSIVILMRVTQKTQNRYCSKQTKSKAILQLNHKKNAFRQHFSAQLPNTYPKAERLCAHRHHTRCKTSKKWYHLYCTSRESPLSNSA